MKIDLTIVAGSRPDLLSRTLASFEAGLFRYFHVAKVIANIDPFGGGVGEQNECASIISRHFSHAQIIKPKSSSFGCAVRAVWENAEADLLFHLEDDWLLLEPIRPEMIEPLLAQGAASVKPVAKEHKWRGDDPFQTKKPVNLLGARLFSIRMPVGFGTSPGFFRGDFIRQYVRLMQPHLDPEKQVRANVNGPLHEYCKSFKHSMLKGQQHRELITDIGREWRDNRNIIKTVKKEIGISVWEQR